MKVIALVALTIATLSAATPIAAPEPVVHVEARAWSAWALSIGSASGCNNHVFSDSDTVARGCTNIGTTGGSVDFSSSSTGSNPVGTFYSGANCQGSSFTSNGDQDCQSGTIKSYKVSV